MYLCNVIKLKYKQMEKEKSTFELLSKINCNNKTEKKNGLTYLSWAWAWGITKENFPSANYRVVQYNGKPYLYDEYLGYIVTTEVTINGETIPMNLPVMDGANKAQKNVQYSYKVAEWANGKKTGNMIDKFVEAATMFDINTAIMRCLTKNLAMFGLGHYIYAGEDLPKLDIDVDSRILECKTQGELTRLFNELNPKDEATISKFTKRQLELSGK